MSDNTHIYLDIQNKLGEIKANQSTLFKKSDELKASIKEHSKFDKRIDRLEQTEKTRKWTLRIVIAAMLGLFGDMFKDLFTD